MSTLRLPFYTLLLCLISLPGWTLVTGPFELKGRVIQVTEQSISLEGDKKTYEIPRSLVAEKNPKTGSEIKIILSDEQLKKVKISDNKAKNTNL